MPASKNKLCDQKCEYTRYKFNHANPSPKYPWEFSALLHGNIKGNLIICVGKRKCTAHESSIANPDKQKLSSQIFMEDITSNRHISAPKRSRRKKKISVWDFKTFFLCIRPENNLWSSKVIVLKISFFPLHHIWFWHRIYISGGGR